MKTEMVTICDAATEQQGKMNLLASFDHGNIRCSNRQGRGQRFESNWIVY